RRRRPAPRRVSGGAARRPGAGDAGLSELPALHPRVPARPAVAVRPEARVRDAGAAVEAGGVVARRAPGERPRTRPVEGDDPQGIGSRVPTEEEPMPIYILLSTLSQQGVQTLRSNPDRLREVNRDVEELGAKVLHQWATLGEFDFVNVVEAPDTATIARVSVALGARGSTRIETLPALTIDEFVQTLS